MTPYKACKLINAELKRLGIDKVLPPQMFYTYRAKGYIDFTSEETLMVWFNEKYLPSVLKKNAVETEVEVSEVIDHV